MSAKSLYENFLLEHQKVISSLGLGEVDISDKMRNPIENLRKYSVAEIENVEARLGFKVHESLKVFLTEFGSFEIYKNRVFPIGEYGDRTKDAKSWIESELEDEEAREKLNLDDLIFFAGYASDGFFMSQTKGKIYSWSHGEPEFATFEGMLDEWFEKFLKRLLKTAKTYWV